MVVQLQRTLEPCTESLDEASSYTIKLYALLAGSYSHTWRIMCTFGSCALISIIVNNGTSRSAPIVSLLPEASIASRSSHFDASDKILMISCRSAERERDRVSSYVV